MRTHDALIARFYGIGLVQADVERGFGRDAARIRRDNCFGGVVASEQKLCPSAKISR
jgi:hypothetical protein